MRKPRMLQLCAVDFTVANLLRRLIDATSEHFQVEVACAPGTESQRLEAEGYTFRYIPFSRGMNPLAHVRALYHLIRLFRREKYDIIHTHTPIAAVLARIAARLCRVPVVVNTVHGFYFHEHMHPLAKQCAEAVERWVGRFTHYNFFQSQEDYEAALRIGICTAETGLWIGNGVDQERFSSDRPDLALAAEAVRREMGVGSSDVLLGVVARLVREKGICELLEAFAAMQAQHPNAHLVLVGDALQSDRDGIRQRIHEALRHPEYGSRIHWLGYRRDVDVVLKALDVFVLPSYREGMPRSIIEAMSMAVPVVATRIRGCREQVVHEVTGLLVPHKEFRPLAEALDQLAGDADMRFRMGQAGLERARGLYDEDLVLARQMAVFQMLCGKGR